MEEGSYYQAPYRVGRGHCARRPEESGHYNGGPEVLYSSVNGEEARGLGYRRMPIYDRTGEKTGEDPNRHIASPGYHDERLPSGREVDPYHSTCNHYHLHLHHHHIQTYNPDLQALSPQTPLEEDQEEPLYNYPHHPSADYQPPLPPHRGPYHSHQHPQYSTSAAPPQRTGLNSNTMEEALSRAHTSPPGAGRGAGRRPCSGDTTRPSGAHRRDKLKKMGSTDDYGRPRRRRSSRDSLEDQQTLEERSSAEFGGCGSWDVVECSSSDLTAVVSLDEPNKCSTSSHCSSSSSREWGPSRQVLDTAPGSASTGVLDTQEELGATGGQAACCRGGTQIAASGDRLTSPVSPPRPQQEEGTWSCVAAGTGGGGRPPPASPGVPGLTTGDYPLPVTPHPGSVPREQASGRTSGSGRGALEENVAPADAAHSSSSYLLGASLLSDSTRRSSSNPGGDQRRQHHHSGGSPGGGGTRGCIHGNNNGDYGNNGGHPGHCPNTGGEQVGLSSAAVERLLTAGSALMEVSTAEQSPPGGGYRRMGGGGNCHYSRVGVLEDAVSGEVGVGRRGRLLSAPHGDDDQYGDDHHPPSSCSSPRRRTDRSHSAPGGGLLLTTGLTTPPDPPTYQQQATPPPSPLTLSPPPLQDHYPASTGSSSSRNHANPASSSRGGGYSSIPVVRVQLADDGGGENDVNAADGNFRCATSAADTVLEDDDDRRGSARSYMEEDGDSGVAGGLQAIDLEELHRRRKQRRKRKWKFAKNTLILSFAFVSLFSATSGLTLLQSSLNRQLGVFSLCANFTAIAVSCLLLPKALIQLLGCKWTIVASMACFMLWIMSNLHPTWATLIPSAVVMGTGWAPLWTAQCTYFTVTGIEYAKWGDDMPDVVIARMFGIFFMIFMTAPIWGNLLSSSVLSTGLYNRTRALPLPGDPESIYRFCGAADCPGIYDNTTHENENYNRPENSLVYTLISIYLGLSLIGLTLVAFFLDSLELDREAGKPRCAPGSLAASFKQMANPYQVFIIPLTVYTGMEQVFLMVEYTRAYATCALGMEKIGYVVSSYAALAALMSLACSQLVNVVGRMPLFLIGAGAHIGCMVVFMRWTPYPDSLVMFIVMPAIWGIGDAIWQSQINAFYGVLFSDQSEAAFSNYRMWESVGFIMSLSYSPFMCVFRKIHILLGVLIAGLLGYFVVEGLYSKASSERETELAKKGVIVEAESAAAEEEEGAFGGVAQMMRRKSTVYLPQRTVREAAEVMRRKSQVFLGGMDNPDRVIRRRLSTFAPVMEVTEDSTPLSSAPSTPGTQRSPAVTSLMTSEDGNTSTGGLVQHRMSEPEVDVRAQTRRNGRITPPMLNVAKRQHFDV